MGIYSAGCCSQPGLQWAFILPAAVASLDYNGHLFCRLVFPAWTTMAIYSAGCCSQPGLQWAFILPAFCSQPGLQWAFILPAAVASLDYNGHLFCRLL
ncbi:hypothetical protein ACOMHN_028159 [Nucella lapillus]